MKQKFRNGNLIEVDNGQDKFLKCLYGSTLGKEGQAPAYHCL